MITEFEKEIGKRIRILRENANLSREALSETAGISPKFLYEIECGKKGMSAITLYHLATALNVSLDHLATGHTACAGSFDFSAVLDRLDACKAKQFETIVRDILLLIA